MTEDRFVLARVGRGAILLDTASGAILELNESAAFVWERRLDGEPAEAIIEALVSRYSLPLESASQDVARVLNPRLEGDPPEVGDFRYEQTPEGYTFTFRGLVIFVLDPDGQRLKLSNDVGEMLTSLLRALAPKLLALQGELVLHASAVELNGIVIAFTGASGAGKTTTARTLTEAGGQIVCEDQLWIARQNARVMVSAGGERAIFVGLRIHPTAPDLGRGRLRQFQHDRPAGRFFTADRDRVSRCSEANRRPLSRQRA